MATTVKTLVKLANELHAAYTARTAFDDNSNCDTMSHREWARQFDLLKRQQDVATDRLAAAIDKSTPDRLKEAEKAMGDNVYVFDGF